MSLGLALLAAPASAAPADAGPRTVRTHIMWFPADWLWTGALPVRGCSARALEPASDVALASPIRTAVWERRGELVAELRGSPAMNLATLATARMCAARAADATTTPALLTAAVETWSTFHRALASCLQAEGAARSVGSMTLWVDTSCNW